MRKFIKNNLKVFIAVLITAIICISGTAYAAIKIQADEIGYKDGTVEDALNNLYGRIGGDNYVDNTIKDILNIFNGQLGVIDILTPSFMNKISTSPPAVKAMLDNSTFRNNASTALLTALNAGLVPSLNSNQNVIYSTQYGGYDGYRAYSDSSYWCSAGTSVSNEFIGYEFNTNVNVRVAKFYNGEKKNNRYLVQHFKLQYSDDNVTWNDASDTYTTTSSSKSEEQFVFNTKNDDAHKYWRILIIDGYYGQYVGMSDLQFYGI